MQFNTVSPNCLPQAWLVPPNLAAVKPATPRDTMAQSMEGDKLAPKDKGGGRRSLDSRNGSRSGSGSGSGSGYESGETVASYYSEDDYDDSAYGTMARFVPTLVLERLRDSGELSLSSSNRTLSGAASADASSSKGSLSPPSGTAEEGVNVPKV